MTASSRVKIQQHKKILPTTFGGLNYVQNYKKEMLNRYLKSPIKENLIKYEK